MRWMNDYLSNGLDYEYDRWPLDTDATLTVLNSAQYYLIEEYGFMPSFSDNILILEALKIIVKFSNRDETSCFVQIATA